MVVQHNLRAMNSNRMLGLTANVQSKSTEKLSSGYKINRAADDAAGLSISEKMRKQIRGLSQASLNASDGISAVQTAEGALNEVQDMLQRMNELAVKAANGTMSEDDRNYIQDEIDQLVTEIDRVAETTKFNETYLLKGDATGETVNTFEYVETRAGIGAATSKTIYDAAGNKVTSFTETTAADAVAAGTYYTGVKGDVATKKTNADAALTDIVDGIGGTLTYKTGKMLYKADGSEIAEADLGTYLLAASGKVKTGVEVYTGVTADTTKAATEADFAETQAEIKKVYKDGVEVAAEDLADYFDEDGNLKADAGLTADQAGTTDIGDANVDEYIVVDEKVKSLTLKLHVGADSTDNNQISVDIDSMSADELGLLNSDGELLVSGADDTNARAAIDTIAAALQQVSTQRSALGAVQNRLEHTIANLDNVVENTTAAESQIRDTDMATEMVKYSNNNILAQAGQAMLAQSNQANQGVLSLLG